MFFFISLVEVLLTQIFESISTGKTKLILKKPCVNIENKNIKGSSSLVGHYNIENYMLTKIMT